MKTVVVGKSGALSAKIAARLSASEIALRTPDATDDRVLDELADADVIVNITGPRVRAELGTDDYFREHVGCAMRIARSVKPGASIVHVSSTAVFGARGRVLGTQDLPAPTLFPGTGYACAKLAAETAITSEGRARGARVTVLRPSMIYGPGVESAISSVIGLARRGVKLTLYPRATRQHLVHEELFCDAIAAAATRPANHLLLLADPFVLTNEDITPSRGVPCPVFLGPAKLARRTLAPLSAGALDALAVLALDNVFDWRPAFEALDLDASHYARNRTFDPYFQGHS